MTRPRTLRAHLIRAAERAGLAWSAVVSGASERIER